MELTKLHEHLKNLPEYKFPQKLSAVIDKYLLLQDIEENGWDKQKLHLITPEIHDKHRFTLGLEIGEGCSLTARKNYVKLIICELVKEYLESKELNVD